VSAITIKVRGGGAVRAGDGMRPGDDDRVEGRDLAVRTDFRTLFAETAAPHLRVAAPKHLFPGWSRAGTPVSPFG
jgi:hypothetical protein